MKNFCIILSGFLTFSLFGQANDNIKIIDNTSHDQFFNITIGDFKTTLYLNFSRPDIPSFASIYARYSLVRGWYKNEEGKKVDGIGVYTGVGNLDLYIPKKSDINSTLDIKMKSFDDIYIFETHQPDLKLDQSNKFSFSKEKNQLVIDNQSYPVKGVDIENNNLERKILLEFAFDHYYNPTIDLSKIIMSSLSMSKEEIAGMNGWAEIRVEFIESTRIENKTNFLIAVTNTGSCNTDASYLLSLTTLELSIFDFTLYETNNCKRYNAYEIGNTYYIFPINNGHKEYSEDDISESIGSYEVINSKVEIKQSWFDN